MQSIVSSEQGANRTKYVWSDCQWNPVCKYDIPADFKIVLKTAERSRSTKIHIAFYPFVILRPMDCGFFVNLHLRSTEKLKPFKSLLFNHFLST